MPNTKKKQFDANYWRNNFDLLISTVEKIEPKKLPLILEYKRRAINKIENDTPRKNASLENDLNAAVKELDQECWERFLREVRDRNYEVTRCRISISTKVFKKLDTHIKKYKFDNANEFIKFAFDNISETKLNRFKIQKQKQ